MDLKVWAQNNQCVAWLLISTTCVCLAAVNDTELGLMLNSYQTCLSYLIVDCLFQVSIHQRKAERMSKYIDHSFKNSLVIRKMKIKPIARYHLHQSDQQNYQILYYYRLLWTWSMRILLHYWWEYNLFYIKGARRNFTDHSSPLQSYWSKQSWTSVSECKGSFNVYASLQQALLSQRTMTCELCPCLSGKTSPLLYSWFHSCRSPSTRANETSTCTLTWSLRKKSYPKTVPHFLPEKLPKQL